MPPNALLKSEYAVYMFFKLGVFVHGYVCQYAIIYISVGSKAVGCVAEDSLRFSSLGAYDGKDRCMSMQFMRAMGRYFAGFFGSFLFGLYVSLVALRV